MQTCSIKEQRKAKVMNRCERHGNNTPVHGAVIDENFSSSLILFTCHHCKPGQVREGGRDRGRQVRGSGRRRGKVNTAEGRRERRKCEDGIEGLRLRGKGRYRG